MRQSFTQYRATVRYEEMQHELQPLQACLKDAWQLLPASAHPQQAEVEAPQVIVRTYHTHTHTHACARTHKYAHTHTYTHTHESSHTLILQGKKKKLNNLVREMGAWGMVMTDEQVSQFLRDGEASWELTQTEASARLLHHGKLLHRSSQSIAR